MYELLSVGEVANLYPVYNIHYEFLDTPQIHVAEYTVLNWKCKKMDIKSFVTAIPNEIANLTHANFIQLVVDVYNVIVNKVLGRFVGVYSVGNELFYIRVHYSYDFNTDEFTVRKDDCLVSVYKL